MGYTHYWKNAGIDTAHHAAIARTVKDIIAAAEYSGSALVDNDSDTVAGIVDVNGRSPDDYENLVIDLAEHGHGFCKTQRRPYDCVIVAILIYLSETYSDSFSWSSDGAGSNHDESKLILKLATT